MRVESKQQVLQLPTGSVDDALACFVNTYAKDLPCLAENDIRVGVAYSGGADSTALLLGTLKRWPERVYALHVNHGLQEAAEMFAQHCEIGRAHV